MSEFYDFVHCRIGFGHEGDNKRLSAIFTQSDSPQPAVFTEEGLEAYIGYAETGIGHTQRALLLDGLTDLRRNLRQMAI